MKRITLESYRHDVLYPRVVRATQEILEQGDTVAPVDVFVEMHLLSKEDVERWRRGQVPFLERVIRCNLSRVGRILRILRMHAHDLNLVPRPTEYRRWGKGPRRTLRFSKSGERPLEEAYRRHFVVLRGRRASAADERTREPRSPARDAAAES